MRRSGLLFPIALLLACTTPALAADGRPVTVTTAPQAVRAVTAADASKAFTYQGMLRSAGAPLSGTADLQFTLWDDVAAGTSYGTQTVTTTVSNGLFTVLLDDAAQFSAGALDGRALWISIAVRSPAGTGAYTTLTPRQALTAAPIASTLAPQAVITGNHTSVTAAALEVNAAAASNGQPVAAIRAAAGNNLVLRTLFPLPTAIQADSWDGYALAGVTWNGTAIYGATLNGGQAGYFDGDVQVRGKLQSDRWRSFIAINSVGPLPLSSAAFTTSGGTLILNYSGSGYAGAANSMIGMTVTLDGVTFVDNTAIFVNNPGQHLAFVPKTWVLSNIPAGTHTISLSKMNVGTQTDANDIFNLTVTELPW